MNKLYLSCFLLLVGIPVLAQETTAPIFNKSNRIIFHFKDTTGLFTQLANALMDLGYDIEMKDRELGILRTKPSTLPGSYSFNHLLEVKTIFKDSTITFAGVAYERDFLREPESRYEVLFTRRRETIVDRSWNAMLQMGEKLQPAYISYSTVTSTVPLRKVETYRRNN